MTFKRLAGLGLKLLLWLVGLLVLLTLLLVAAAEWQYRSALQAPPSTDAIPAAIPAATGSAAPNAPDAPVVILLHGAALNREMWAPVIRHLDPRLRVIALDLPGHGARTDKAFTLEAAAAEIAAAARSVAPAPVILAGDSLGGYSAMAAAASVPKSQLRGLIVSGASANFSADQFPAYLGNVVLIDGVSAFADTDKFAAKALGVFGVAEADRPAIVAQGVHLGALISATRSLMGVDMRTKLAAVEVPVLIVNGDQDTRSMAQQASFVAVARHGSVYDFKDTAHGVSLRRSAEFATLINDFAARVAPPAPAASSVLP